ncbi:MAG: type II toxin-antitoxin system VapC family toxin [Xanthomonadaceae bacterium]|nr:type II toxin-antitoxin system VapC family toxin [Xanthomonadaceae bacterium]
MIILDTDLISEPLRRDPEPRVVAWIDAQPMKTLYLTAISAAELRAGVALLPTGKRRSSLQDSLEQTILPLFTGRVLPFDLDCASAYARLLAKTRKTGQAIATADAFIAAIALTHNYAVATRDTTPFRHAGLIVINPWEPT